MDYQNIKDILADPVKKVNQSRNLLTQLYRQVLVDLNIGNKTFDNLVKRYLMDPNSGIADDPVARNNHRGNLMKELGNPDMTWRVFLKGLRVLGVSEFELVLNIKRRDTITKHIVFAKNNISYEEPKDDLSNAVVINTFESAQLAEQQKRNTATTDKPSIKAELPEGLTLPKGI